MKRKNLNYFALLLCISMLAASMPLVQGIASSGMAKDAIDRSQNAINFMESAGLSTSRVNDLLIEAKFSYDTQKYDAVIATEQEILTLKELAFSLKNRLNATEILLQDAKELGFEVNESSQALDAGMNAFAISNYEETEHLLAEIDQALQPFFQYELSYLKELAREITAKNEHGILIVQEYVEITENALKSVNVSGIALLKSEIEGLNESISLLNAVHQKQLKLQERSIKSSRTADLWEESIIAIERGSFILANERLHELGLIADIAMHAQDQIQEAQYAIEQAQKENLDTKNAQRKLQESQEEFNKGVYEKATQLLTEIKNDLQGERGASLLANISIKGGLGKTLKEFLMEYWPYISAIAIVMGAAGVFGIRIASKKLIAHKIYSMQKEQQALQELMKKEQEKYFKTKSISKETYETVMDEYQERLLQIHEQLPLLLASLEKKQAKT